MVFLLDKPQVFCLPVWLGDVTGDHMNFQGNQAPTEMQKIIQGRSQNQGQSPAEAFRNAEKMADRAGMVGTAL